MVVLVTEIVLETVAGLVGVGEAGVERSRPVVLDLLLDLIRHLQAAGALQRTNRVCECVRNTKLDTEQRQRTTLTQMRDSLQSERQNTVQSSGYEHRAAAGKHDHLLSLSTSW